MHSSEDVALRVGINEKLPGGMTALYGFQHLLALTGIWIFPILIGQALGLENTAVSYIIQACFLTTGIVTVLQSGKLLKLPVVQGPTAAFFVAVLAAGQSLGLGTAFGSMMVAGAIFMVLSLPIKRFGLMGLLIRFISPPMVYGTLLVIIGAQLAGIGLKGWFGVQGMLGYGALNFGVGCATAAIVIACMVLGGNGVIKRGALLWGIIGGTLIALVSGAWTAPDVSSAGLINIPQFLPFGFGVSAPLVILMLLAFLQAGAEAMGMYTLLTQWGKEELTPERVNRGLFSEFLGSVVGAAFGGLGTTSYPENIGIIRITRIGSRYVTLAAGIFAIVLSLFPKLALFIAALPGPVLGAASTILFGIIAVSGIQILNRVEWDELNLAVAAPSFIISLGTMFLPADVVALLPSSVASIVTQPMMVGVIMLVVLNTLVNMVIRPRLVGAVSMNGVNAHE